MRKSVRWYIQSVNLNFVCPRCGGHFPNGNPLHCDHRQFGDSLHYDPKIDGPVDGLPDLLRSIGYFKIADEMEGKL